MNWIDSVFRFHQAFSSFGNYVWRYARVAEAVDSTDAEEDGSGVNKMQELVEELNSRDDKKGFNFREQKNPKLVGGMGQVKYNMLRKRQVKMETEAWDEAAKEYQELLVDMCEQKLAPNLPYMKSLFLGWFEPLRDVIIAEQELCKQGKNRTAYALYFDHLLADMMAVITMHKLMGLLMTGRGHGSARVVQAASQIGEAIEHEVRIHMFLEKTKKKNVANKKLEGETDPVSKEQEKKQEKLRRKVTMLMKMQRVEQV